MHFDILCSGSKGNCSVISSEKTRIIIDCGSTAHYLKQGFDAIGVDYQKCDAILITHEHSDHVKQIKMFADLPVYAPFAIYAIANEHLIEPYKPFEIGDLTILPIALSHDTDICVGFIITDGRETLVSVTDTGYISETNFKLIQGADYYIFESNHDPEMLMATHRPNYTKRRILSDAGHMSNEYAAEILCKCIADNTKEIVLAHISQEANDYDLAYYTTRNALLAHKLNRPDLRVTAVKQFEIYQSGRH